MILPMGWIDDKRRVPQDWAPMIVRWSQVQVTG
jgi:hypothetical protein